MNSRLRDKLIAEIYTIFSSDEHISKHLGSKTISVYSNYFIDNNLTQIIPKDLQEKIIYCLSAEAYFNENIKTKIDKIFLIFQLELDSLRNGMKKIEYLSKHTELMFDVFEKILCDENYSLDDSNSFLNDYLNLYYSEFRDKGLAYNKVSYDIKKLKSFSDNITPYDLQLIFQNKNYVEDLKITTKAYLKRSTELHIAINGSILSEDFIILSNPFPKIGKPTKKEVVIIDETLYTIWESENTEYLEEILNELTKPLLKYNDVQFVKTFNGEKIWNEGSKDFAKYLAGFFYKLVEKEWVKTPTSAPKIAKILSNTFHRKKQLDPKVFRNIDRFNEKKYIAPFDFIKENRH
jgi:hypothetical protein